MSGSSDLILTSTRDGVTTLTMNMPKRLNGWTMGNIAVAPKDIVSMYHDLATGRLISADSLAQMLDWKKLTMGTAPRAGTP